MDFDIVFHMYTICSDQSNLLSIITTKNILLYMLVGFTVHAT